MLDLRKLIVLLIVTSFLSEKSVFAKAPQVDLEARKAKIMAIRQRVASARSRLAPRNIQPQRRPVIRTPQRQPFPPKSPLLQRRVRPPLGPFHRKPISLVPKRVAPLVRQPISAKSRKPSTSTLSFDKPRYSPPRPHTPPEKYTLRFGDLSSTHKQYVIQQCDAKRSRHPRENDVEVISHSSVRGQLDYLRTLEPHCPGITDHALNIFKAQGYRE